VRVTGSDLQIKSLFLQGPAGKLEALLNLGTTGPTHAALVCHPHPLHGGTFHNKVVFQTMKALHTFGFPVLRFNFRGTGLSEGVHDDGRGEVEDAHAALDWLDREFGVPLLCAGFSFGSAVALRSAFDDTRVQALIGLGLPATAAEKELYRFDYLASCTKPKLFVSGDRDQWSPQRELRELVAGFVEPKQVTVISGADHFFAGRLAELRHTIESWVESEVVKRK
jgi:alpha/beta superfamily hydrolase